MTDLECSECCWLNATANRDSERQIVLEIQRVSSSPHSDLRHVLSSSRGPCVDERPRRSTTRQPFASIGNLSHSNHQQRRLNALPASGTHSTDCATSPAGVLRRTTTVNLHTANASTVSLISYVLILKHTR